MELYADKPGMVRALDDFRKAAVRGQAGEAHAGFLQLLAEGDIHLIAMTVPLGYLGIAVEPLGERPLLEESGIGPQPHGAAKIILGTALLSPVAGRPLGH